MGGATTEESLETHKPASPAHTVVVNKEIILVSRNWYPRLYCYLHMSVYLCMCVCVPLTFIFHEVIKKLI